MKHVASEQKIWDKNIVTCTVSHSEKMKFDARTPQSRCIYQRWKTKTRGMDAVDILYSKLTESPLVLSLTAIVDLKYYSYLFQFSSFYLFPLCLVSFNFHFHYLPSFSYCLQFPSYSLLTSFQLALDSPLVFFTTSCLQQFTSITNFYHPTFYFLPITYILLTF